MASLRRVGPLGLVPLVPLMIHHRSLEAVFDECLRRVREAPEDKLATLELILAVLASRRLPKEIILEKDEQGGLTRKSHLSVRLFLRQP